MSERGEFDDTEPLARDRRTPIAFSRNGSAGLFLTATYVTLGITLGSLIFTAGYNWRGLTEVRIAQERTLTMVLSDYVRKDVEAQQQLTIAAKLDEIKAQLAALQRAIEQGAQ